MEEFKPQKIQEQPMDDEKRLSGQMASERGTGFIDLSDIEEKKKEKKERELKEGWEKKQEELRALYRQISKRSNEDPEFARKISKERQEFNFVIGALPPEYGKPQDYVTCHHFAGGTTNYEYSPKADLPGEFSIVGFYQRCIADDFPLQEGRGINNL